MIHTNSKIYDLCFTTSDLASKAQATKEKHIQIELNENFKNLYTKGHYNGIKGQPRKWKNTFRNCISDKTYYPAYMGNSKNSQVPTRDLNIYFSKNEIPKASTYKHAQHHQS